MGSRIAMDYVVDDESWTVRRRGERWAVDSQGGGVDDGPWTVGGRGGRLAVDIEGGGVDDGHWAIPEGG